MAAKSGEAGTDSLKCQTSALKVSLHCQGCKKKVKKVLQSIDGVYAVGIDSQKQKVTVTGNVEPATLVKTLVKAGKRAEIWPEPLETKEKNPAGKPKNNKKQTNPETVQKVGGEDADQKKKPEAQKPAARNKGDEESPEAEEHVGESEEAYPSAGGGNGGKKKKKKGKQGGGAPAAGDGSPPRTEGVEPVVGSVNLGPPSQQMYPYPPTYYPVLQVPAYPSTHISSYSYYDPHMHGFMQPRSVYPPPPPSDVIHMFRYDDDKAYDWSGCWIM